MEHGWCNENSCSSDSLRWAPRALITALQADIAKQMLSVYVYPIPLVSVRGPAYIEKVLNTTVPPQAEQVTVFVIVNDYEGILYSNQSCRQILVRASSRRSWLRSNELVLPWTDPELRAYPPLLHTGFKKPAIGFVGRSNKFRRPLIYTLQRDKRVQTNFTLHYRWWGGSRDSEAAAVNFMDNLAASHFVMSTRGAGNYAMRFYQVMASGRIPIVHDVSDLALPLPRLINWAECPIIANTTDKIVHEVLRLWSIPGEIERRQARCAQIFRRHLAPKPFARHVLRWAMGSTATGQASTRRNRSEPCNP